MTLSDEPGIALAPRRRSVWRGRWLVIFFVGAGFAAFGINRAIHTRHPLGSDRSPDGTMRADYAYSSRDLIGWVMLPSANPVLHLTLTDVRTGQVISRDEYLGDMAELSEARDRFRDKIPWEVFPSGTP